MEREITEPNVLRMERTEEERQRRHNEGDKGAKFSAAKELKPRRDGISNTLTSSTKDNLLCEPMAMAHPFSHKKENPKPMAVCPTLRATDYKCPTCVVKEESRHWRIRKFTPVETGRLMGLHDDEIQKMYDAGIPKTQLYKLHGNSIVVNVLQEIFRKMFIEKQNESRQPTLF